MQKLMHLICGTNGTGTIPEQWHSHGLEIRCAQRNWVTKVPQRVRGIAPGETGGKATKTRYAHTIYS